jgi:hypothetical protein
MSVNVNHGLEGVTFVPEVPKTFRLDGHDSTFLETFLEQRNKNTDSVIVVVTVLIFFFIPFGDSACAAIAPG